MFGDNKRVKQTLSGQLTLGVVRSKVEVGHDGLGVPFGGIVPSAISDGSSQRMRDSGAFFEISFRAGIAASASEKKQLERITSQQAFLNFW